MVIHAAGRAHLVPKNKGEDEEFYKVNLNGTKNLLEGLEKSGRWPEQFVFISSVAVYGKEEGEYIDEDERVQGATPYAISKIQTETLLQTWADNHKVRLTILRLPLVVGEHPPGNLGAMIQLMKTRLYVGVGSGLARKSMVLADDVARFIPTVGPSGGLYNLTDGHHPSMLELEAAVAKQLNRRAPLRLSDNVIRLAARVGDVFGDASPINSYRYRKLIASLTFSDAKARNLVGWNPRSVIDHLPKLS